MAMLYLTPVLPLGLVSYMCGTTAMDLYSFSVAKIASLPLYLMYTFMGASAHSFIKGGKGGNANDSLGKSLTNEANKLEENQVLIVSGLVLSLVMITLITGKIRKELMKVRSGWKSAVARDPNDSIEAHRGYCIELLFYQWIFFTATSTDFLPNGFYYYYYKWFLLLLLLQILDKQKKEKGKERVASLGDSGETEEKTIELGLTARRKTTNTRSS